MPIISRRKEEKKRRKRQFKIVVYLLFIIGIVTLTMTVLQIIKSLNKSLWMRGESRLSLVIYSKSLMIASFDPVAKDLNVLNIPDTTYIEASHGYGFYQVGALLELGRIEKLNEGLLIDSLQDYFAIPIDGWLVDFGARQKDIKETDFKNNSEIKNFLSREVVETIRNEYKTNLSKFDLIKIWWDFRNLRLNKINLINLKETNVIKELRLSDETLVAEVDLSLSDQLVSRLFSDRKVREENLAIGIYNGTNISGLANQAARLVSNFSGQIVKVGDWEEELKECQVRTSKINAQKYTTKKILGLFPCEFYEEDANGGETELILILGTDYAQSLKGK